MHSLKKIIHQLQTQETTSVELVQKSFQTIEESQKVNAYISLFKEQSLEKAYQADKKIQNGQSLGLFEGVPIAIKDVIVMDRGKTTCGSKMLENFKSPYTATVVQKLESQGAIVVGKTNTDEFAMGSSTETSFFGNTLNPLNNTLIPGGSSGGSAAAVAANTVPMAIASDTGGSIRQPAACCGVVGLKPTYGLISRYGLVAFASSLDQIGSITHNVEDCAFTLNTIAGQDPFDQTSSTHAVLDFTQNLQQGIQGKVIGVPQEYFENTSSNIKNDIDQVLQKMEKEGAILKPISLPNMEYGIAAYYVIATAEASSNLSRFDGVRYTTRAKQADNLQELYSNTRSECFGTEVKRRIMLGTFVLSSGFYDAYYVQAQKVRTKITEDFIKAFEQVDIIASPTMMDLPPLLGSFK